jgi:hypothetical protein
VGGSEHPVGGAAQEAVQEAPGAVGAQDHQVGLDLQGEPVDLPVGHARGEVYPDPVRVQSGGPRLRLQVRTGRSRGYTFGKGDHLPSWPLRARLPASRPPNSGDEGGLLGHVNHVDPGLVGSSGEGQMSRCLQSCETPLPEFRCGQDRPQAPPPLHRHEWPPGHRPDPAADDWNRRGEAGGIRREPGCRTRRRKPLVIRARGPGGEVCMGRSPRGVRQGSRRPRGGGGGGSGVRPSSGGRRLDRRRPGEEAGKGEGIGGWEGARHRGFGRQSDPAPVRPGCPWGVLRLRPLSAPAELGAEGRRPGLGRHRSPWPVDRPHALRGRR